MLDLPLASIEGSHEGGIGDGREKMRLRSGRVAALTLGTARVRVEIAGRAHRGKFTPEVGISCVGINVKKKQEVGS